MRPLGAGPRVPLAALGVFVAALFVGCKDEPRPNAAGADVGGESSGSSDAGPAPRAANDSGVEPTPEPTPPRPDREPTAAPDPVAQPEPQPAAAPDPVAQPEPQPEPATAAPDAAVDAGSGERPIDCAASPPALAFDRIAVVEGNRLVLRSFGTDEPVVATSWSDAFVASRPVAFQASFGPEFLVALSNGESCRVRAVDKSGEVSWTTAIAARRCLAPTPSADGLWLPLELEDGTGSLELLRLSDGERLFATALPSPPRTSLAALGGGGGSHWLGGADDGLFVVESKGTTATVWQHATPELGSVHQLAVFDESRFAAASTSALALFRVDVASQTMEAVGDPIVTPGPVTSNLVASTACGDRAGGATHFFCDAGIVAAGGEGWLSAWRLDDGEPWFGESLDETLHGLALLGDGMLVGGGSHWLDREGRVRLYTLAGPTASLEVAYSAEASGPRCVGSPVVDTDGKLGLAVVSEDSSALITVETDAPGLASGWSREGGDNPASSTVADSEATCEAGAARLFERFAGPELERSSSLIALPNGGFAVGGVGTGGVLAGFSAGGVQVWSHTLPAPSSAVTALAVSGELLLGFALVEDTVQVAVLGQDGSVVDERSEAIPGLAALIGAHTLADGNVVLVGARTVDPALPAPAASDAVLLVFDASGALVGSSELLEPTTLVPLASGVVPGTTELVLTGSQAGAAGFAARVALDGTVLWFDTVLSARADLRGVAAMGYIDGSVTVAFADGPHTLLHRYDVFGTRTVTAPTPLVSPVALDANAAGTWFLDALGGLHRVLDQLTLVPLRLAPSDVTLTAVDIAPVGAGAVILADARDGEGDTRVFLAHVDEEARSSCASAGLCVVPRECQSDDTCSLGSCEPTTGECSIAPAPDLASCGGNDVCYAGNCGPVPPDVEIWRTLEASACYDVSSYAECVPASLAYQTLVLRADGSIDTFDPTATGTWSEPTGPGSIELVFRDSTTGDLMSTFTGALAFDRCWEGTIVLANTGTGAFRACQAG